MRAVKPLDVKQTMTCAAEQVGGGRHCHGDRVFGGRLAFFGAPEVGRELPAAPFPFRRAVPVRFHFPRDAVHGQDRFQRILTDCRLRGKHHRVGAVDDGIGHVGRFGARGAGVLTIDSSICVAVITGLP